MALMPWQRYMKEWEVKLDQNMFDIINKTKLSETKLMEVIEILKEYDVIKD